MWIFFAFGSALFAGLTAILAKCGIRKTDSTVATAIRTIVVLAFSWLMVFITGSQGTISSISGRTLLFLVLSGLATGASWLCYFRALQLGDVNKVVPIDKSSTVLTILLAAIFLREGVSLTKGIGVVLIAAGTFLMIEKKESTGETKSAAWLWYALGSAVFASLTAILGKVGILPNAAFFADLPSELEAFNEFAKAVQDMSSPEKQLPKLKALLEQFEVQDIATAISLTECLDDYVLTPEISSPQETAIDQLHFMRDDHSVELLLSHVNLYAYGCDLIKEDNAVLSPYGLLHRADYQPMLTPVQKASEANMAMR